MNSSKYYTICTKDEWRADNFDPYYYETVYGAFFSYGMAKERAKEIDGVVIVLVNKIFTNH